jgi:hypothetical protein
VAAGILIKRAATIEHCSTPKAIAVDSGVSSVALGAQALAPKSVKTNFVITPLASAVHRMLPSFMSVQFMLDSSN